MIRLLRDNIADILQEHFSKQEAEDDELRGKEEEHGDAVNQEVLPKFLPELLRDKVNAIWQNFQKLPQSSKTQAEGEEKDVVNNTPPKLVQRRLVKSDSAESDSDNSEALSTQTVKRPGRLPINLDGETEVLLQHGPTEDTIKLSLLRAGNLKLKKGSMKTYAEVFLMPGKQQLQNSKIIKHTRYPAYNQDFEFPLEVTAAKTRPMKAKTLKVSFFRC